VEDAAGRPKKNAAAIVIGHAPTMSINQLSRILRLSHAGTSVLSRETSSRSDRQLDRRIMSLALTTDGWRPDKLLALRRAALTVLLNQVEAQLNG